MLILQRSSMLLRLALALITSITLIACDDEETLVGTGTTTHTDGEITLNVSPVRTVTGNIDKNAPVKLPVTWLERYVGSDDFITEEFDARSPITLSKTKEYAQLYLGSSIIIAPPDDLSLQINTRGEPVRYQPEESNDDFWSTAASSSLTTTASISAPWVINSIEVAITPISSSGWPGYTTKGETLRNLFDGNQAEAPLYLFDQDTDTQRDFRIEITSWGEAINAFADQGGNSIEGLDTVKTHLSISRTSPRQIEDNGIHAFFNDNPLSWVALGHGIASFSALVPEQWDIVLIEAELTSTLHSDSRENNRVSVFLPILQHSQFALLNATWALNSIGDGYTIIAVSLIDVFGSVGYKAALENWFNRAGGPNYSTVGLMNSAYK